jgi:hypothetical protein
MESGHGMNERAAVFIKKHCSSIGKVAPVQQNKCAAVRKQTNTGERGTMEDNFNAKQYLSQLRNLDMKIEQKKEELSLLHSELTKSGGIDYAKDRVQSSPRNSHEARICRYIELEEEVKEQISSYAQVRHWIIEEIHEMENERHIDILYKRYVEFKGFGAIARETNFSYEYVRHLHRDALRAFKKMKVNTK